MAQRIFQRWELGSYNCQPLCTRWRGIFKALLQDGVRVGFLETSALLCALLFKLQTTLARFISLDSTFKIESSALRLVFIEVKLLTAIFVQTEKQCSSSCPH